MEKQIGEQIYNALQGSVVEEVLRKTKTSNSDAYWRSAMEGHSLKVEKELLSDFYELCHDVKRKLQYEEDVDFYITGDSSVNAFSVAAENEGEPHIVNINSALFGLMSKDELRFVIGHELGHLINKDTALTRLIHFVFPPNAEVPVTLQYKIRLHEQLAELVADRYGYIATENLDVCVTAFFKLASGLDLGRMNVSIEALIADNNRRLNYFLNDRGVSRASHPVNPIRVQALNLFATAKSKQELDNGMEELISILLKVGCNELDEHTAKFIATAGLIVANSDGEVSKEEVEQIIQSLAGLKIFPRKFLDEIAGGDVIATFNESVGNILEINPGMRDGMLKYMIHIVLSDKIIAKEEVDMIYKFGNSIGLSDIEIATAIAEAIQQCYVPGLDAIC
jgi:Zn-dependent protease with chaperone function/uncharacterized tellurite resistance protein B-like protein